MDASAKMVTWQAQTRKVKFLPNPKYQKLFPKTVQLYMETNLAASTNSSDYPNDGPESMSI